MGELAFQTALVRFLTDPTLRNLALDGEETAGGNGGAAGVSTEDLARLRQLDHGRTAVFSELLLLNRVSKVVEGLPWTTALLGNGLWPMANEFNQACPPTHAKKLREAIAFAEFLQERIASRPAEPPFLADVVAYEAAVLELRFEAALETAPPLADGAAPAVGRNGRRPGWVPFLLPGSRVVALGYDVEAIGQAIGRGESPTSPPQRPTCVLLRLDPSGVVLQDEINLPTLLFLEACDGTASLEAISADLAMRLGREGALADFSVLCQQLAASLVDRGVLGVRPG
jgi:hypothetical protein